MGVAVWLLALGCAGNPAPAHPERPETGPTLPLSVVRLYDVGLGYFERQGSLEAASSTGLPVPVSHVDDALKTLIVLGDGQRVSVSGIEFGSVLSESLARVLAGIPVGSSKAIRYVDVLRSLRGLGIKVDFRDPKRAGVEGTLIEVSPLERATTAETKEASDSEDEEHSASPSGQPALEVFALTLLQKDGGLRNLTTNEVEAVYPEDPAVGERLGLAASTLTKRAAQLQRELRVDANSTGTIRIGYMAEAPVWRATYRLVLGEAKQAVLQGWALVHNDTDESWAGVAVELINGRPDSFLFPLAAPRYSRRALAEPSQPLSTAPQLSRSTADQMWGDYVEPDAEEGESGLGLSGYGEGGGGRGEGIGLGSIGQLGHGSGSSGAHTTSSDAISIGNLASITPAAGDEGLTLYSYDLGTRVNVRAHGSALVPFLGEPVTFTRLTWFGHGESEGRSAGLLRNSTNKTLPPGVLAVYEADGFGGESALERLKPTERQLLQFGYDLDVELERETLATSDQTKLVKFRKDELERHYVRERRIRYSLSNRGGLPRTVQVALGIGDNASVEGADALDYHEGQGGPAAKFECPAASKRSVELTIREGLEDGTSLEHLDLKALDALLGDAALPAEPRAILQSARANMLPLEELRKQRRALQSERAELERRQERLHQHERQLASKDETPEVFVTRLLAIEDEVTKADEREKELAARIRAAERDLAATLQALAPRQ